MNILCRIFIQKPSDHALIRRIIVYYTLLHYKLLHYTSINPGQAPAQFNRPPCRKENPDRLTLQKSIV